QLFKLLTFVPSQVALFPRFPRHSLLLPLRPLLLPPLRGLRNSPPVRSGSRQCPSLRPAFPGASPPDRRNQAFRLKFAVCRTLPSRNVRPFAPNRSVRHPFLPLRHLLPSFPCLLRSAPASPCTFCPSVFHPVLRRCVPSAKRVLRSVPNAVRMLLSAPRSWR